MCLWEDHLHCRQCEFSLDRSIAVEWTQPTACLQKRCWEHCCCCSGEMIGPLGRADDQVDISKLDLKVDRLKDHRLGIAGHDELHCHKLVTVILIVEAKHEWCSHFVQVQLKFSQAGGPSGFHCDNSDWTFQHSFMRRRSKTLVSVQLSLVIPSPATAVAAFWIHQYDTAFDFYLQ